MKCWLCERGTNLDDGGLRPGEIAPNFFGDLECVYCTNKIEMTMRLMNRPELIPLVMAMEKLPRVDGVMVGIRFEHITDS